ncbi:alpha/beta hydrolase fold domain-containing protein [Candidatus Hydrogenedentota bacterium]
MKRTMMFALIVLVVLCQVSAGLAQGGGPKPNVTKPKDLPAGPPKSSGVMKRELGKFADPIEYLVKPGPGGTEWEGHYRSFIQSSENAVSKGYLSHAEATAEIKNDAAANDENLQKHKNYVLYIKYYSNHYRPEEGTQALSGLFKALVAMEFGETKSVRGNKSVKGQKNPLPLDGDPRVTIHRDVVYGKDDPKLQSMDAYLVKSDKPTPVVIQIHGGGWNQGGKSSNRIGIEHYIDGGISLVSIAYRLTSVGPWPMQLEDSARAVQFVKSKASEWNIDPDKVALLGGSAGGHIVMMLAFSPDFANQDSKDPVERLSTKVQCIIQRGGPYDLGIMMRNLLKDDKGKPGREADQGKNNKLLLLTGLKPEDMGSEKFYKRLREVSPVSIVSKEAPPVFIQYRGPEGVTSSDDPRMEWHIHTPISGYLLKEKLDTLGVPCEMLVKPSLRDDWAGVVKKHVAFIKKHCGIK